MNIALDYDQTYTRDPKTWNEVIDTFQAGGHNVYVVTMRNSEGESKPVKEALANRVEGIFFTNRKAKQTFMFDRGISIDVWIDDTPYFVNNDAK
jgi:hypothetical protein